MSATATTEFFSVNQIAREMQVPPHRIRYLIESRLIEPVGRVGSTRLWDQGVIDRLKGELAGMRRRGVDATQKG